MNTVGQLVTEGIGKKRLNNIFISKPRIMQYIPSDWNYENIFIDKLQLEKTKQILNIDQQFIKKINQYIEFSKKYKRLPTIHRIIDFFERQIDETIANKIFFLISKKNTTQFQYDQPIFVDTINDIQTANTILIKKELLIKLIKQKKIEYRFGSMYLNNIRIVENKLNSRQLVILTNQNKLKIVLPKNKEKRLV